MTRRLCASMRCTYPRPHDRRVVGHLQRIHNGDIAKGTSIYKNNIEVSEATRYAKEHRPRAKQIVRNNNKTTGVSERRV